MPELTVKEILRVVNGEAINIDENIIFKDFHFDSRQVTENTLFFALKTGTNDGHNYLREFSKKQNVGAVVSRLFHDTDIDVPLIQVEDTEAAYKTLAAYVREKQQHTTYIGITGSAGKTTTKEFTHQIISRWCKTFRSPGNWNNWIGLPFSLLKMDHDVSASVFELAMSSPGIGEIDFLAEILRPNIAVILNTLPVHLEFLHTVENVALAKLEILNYLQADDVALINGDDDFLKRATRHVQERIIYFGKRNDANDIVLKEVLREGARTRMVIDFQGREEEFVTNVWSDSQIDNLFAAIIISHLAGMKHQDIRLAVPDLVVPQGRGVVTRHKGLTIIDETYNANPEAVKKLLKWASRAFKQPKIAVLGDMLELGDDEMKFHLDVGRYLADLGFSKLITVGEKSRWIAQGARNAGFPKESIHSVESSVEVGRYLRGNIPPDSVLVFKASRGIGLEKAIQKLLE